MAKLNDRRCHIAFMDSRARGLQEKVDILNRGEYLDIREHGGATFHQLARRASAHLVKYPFDVVYVAGGVCDISHKDHDTKKVSFNWNSTDSLTNHLTTSLSNENEFLTKNHRPQR